ncbi:MAG: chitobiase/beta-hexosaminidase C-terminal domain-containing protein [Lachnospiraceae bacterium]|nr:chitobiase/beta-hexosaminidase C-terminal domain-containing protein [Lachnospiraceae bacterium]
MSKRIVSAFLVFVLLVSSVDINALAMPDIKDGVSENALDSYDAVENDSVEEDTAKDAVKEDDTVKSDEAEDDTAKNDVNEDDTVKNDTVEDDSTNSDEAEDDASKNDETEDDASKSDEAETDASKGDTTEDNATEDSDAENDEKLEDKDSIAEDETEAEAPSYSTTESFLIDTESPYDGDYLLVANVSTIAGGASESVGELPTEDAASYNMESSNESAFSSENPYIYDFDDNGRGIIDPASFLPEPVFDEAGVDYQASEETAETTYYIGYERIFYLDRTSGATYDPVECVCVAISKYSTVWVPLDDPIYVKNAGDMQEYMDELAKEFDNQFPKMTESFGSKERVDELYGDNDGKTALLCYDIDGNGMSGDTYTAGYFYYLDLNINHTKKTKNNIDCLHIDSWHGMNRKTASNTLDPLYSKRTMVHELQHMINYSICRDNENSFNKLNIPTYLNEAYSEAAAHLCYGAATNRIKTYNQYSYIDEGKVSLLNWGGYHKLSNYALSYLFSQYIRIQYENGENIYKDTMADLTETNDLFGIIANKLGVSREELLFNFHAALFLKNAEGEYGFGGEAWAETFRSKSTKADTALSLEPGAAVVIPFSDSFEPSGAGKNIRFAGMYKELTKDDVEVQVTGVADITQELGELQLSATVLPKGVSQSVIFSLPYEADRVHAEVTADGLVSALSNGTVTVRAASVLNPARYTDVKINISGQQAVIVEHTRDLLLNGIRVKYTITRPEDAVLYYTMDGTEPTLSSDEMPEEGLLYDKKGSYVLRIWAHDPSGEYRDCYNKENIVIEQVNEPVIIAQKADAENVFAYNITIQANEGETVYYTTDETTPSIGNGIKYNGGFTIDTPGTTILRAVAIKEGMTVSNVVTYEVRNYAELVMEQRRSPVFGGIRVNYTASKPENVEFYYTMDGTEPTTDSTVIPDDGILFDEAGSYTLKVLGHAPNEGYRDAYDEDEIVVEQLKGPVIDAQTEVVSLGIQRMTIKAEEGAVIYYTKDSSIPSMENGIKYEDSFTIDTLGTTTVKAVALKEGMADSSVVSRDIKVQYSHEYMSESERKPYMTQMSFSLNKKSTEGVRFSILPIMEKEIVDAKFVDDSGDFLLKRLAGKNNWSLSLINKDIVKKTYQTKVRVISKTSDNEAYADVIDIKIKITDVSPKVSLKAVTINTAYPLAGYPIVAASKSGKVAILGIGNGNNTGFIDNFEIKDGMIYLKKPYNEFVKTASNKPVLSGKLYVQVDGYEPQELNLNIKTTNKAPVLTPSASAIRLNYNKLSDDKSFDFTLDKKISAKEKIRISDIKAVSLNENAGKNYRNVAGLLQDDNAVSCSDGQHIKVRLKTVKAGTYTLPLLISAGTEEDTFRDVSCNVKFTIEKADVLPGFKLSTAKLKLNRRTSGEKAYIAVRTSAQSNLELADVECEYSETTGSVNKDKNVSLAYNVDTKQLEAKIVDEPAGNTYKFECTSVYKGISGNADEQGETEDGRQNENGDSKHVLTENIVQNKAQDNIKGKTVIVTVTIIDKAPTVTLKAKGSIDVLNRDSSAITYTIKKTNFTDEITRVDFARASKITSSILDARDFFNAPLLNEDSTVTVSAKKDVVFTKGMKYAFRLKFKLKDNQKVEIIATKDIIIKPRQSSVKLKATAKPVFYTYVNRGNNTQDVTLQSNNGIIEKVEYNESSNKKVPKGIEPIFDEYGQLKRVTFDGSENIKKGSYKLTFHVYYKGQMWEKATSRKESYAKAKVVRLTVVVK